MKKILFNLFLPLFLALGAQATSFAGKAQITLKNNSYEAVLVGESALLPGENEIFSTNNKGSLEIKQGTKKYTLNCLAPHASQSHDITALDFSTLEWLAQAQRSPESLDHIEIENDTLYPIIVRYYLTKKRSIPAVPHRIVPHAVSSKTVRDETGSQNRGVVEIIDGHNQKHTVAIARRVCAAGAMNTQEWKSIKLCASTIALYNKSFSITVN